MTPQVMTTREDFEYWLASMDYFLEELIAQFPIDKQAHLNYSIESLDFIESWILPKYASSEEMLHPKESKQVNRIACYVGETYRKQLGGKWDIELNDTEFVFFGLPILKGEYDSECPLSLTTATANRRTGSYLRTVLVNSMKD